MIDKQRLLQVSRLNSRILALIFPLVAVAAFLLSTTTPASAHQHKLKLYVGEKQISLTTPLYLDHSGQIFAPAEVFEAMGYTTKLSDDSRILTIEDWRKSIDWQTQIHDDHPLVPLAAVASALNASYNFDKDNRTVTILAKILLVREDSDKLSVSTSFPVPVHSEGLDNPNRVFLDISGAALSTPKVTIPVSGDDVSAVRAAQTTDSSVRIVVDLKRKLGYRQVASAVPNHFEIALVGSGLRTGLAHPAIPLTVISHNILPKAVPVVVVKVPVPTATLVSDETTTTDDPSPAQSADAPQIENIICDHTGDSLTVYVDVQAGSDISANPYHAFMLDNPNRLAFDIPGATFNLPPELSDSNSSAIDLGSSIATRLRWGTTDPTTIGGKSSARIVLDLSRAVEFQISSSDISGGMTRYTISVQASKLDTKIAQVPDTTPKPDNASVTGPAPEEVIKSQAAITTQIDTGVVVISPPSSPGITVTPAPVTAPTPAITPDVTTPLESVPDSVLSGKTIVVDPGHGGKDEGAPGVHGILEKNVVLAIGKIVKDDLVACGAKVIMTRADDTFIPLADRSQMGIDYHADFFVSIHADSSGVENSHNGTTVYYHSNNATCRSFAESISQRLSEIASDDDIKSDGVRSDFVRFPGVGFSVLRRSPEPAILVETGYVDSDTDCSHLIDSETQHTIASAIVAGLKDYISQGSGTASLSHKGESVSSSGTVALTAAPPTP